MNCPNCHRDWPDSSATALGGGCPHCLLEFALGESDDWPAPDADAPPTHLGPYTIHETLGRGGMGVVYQAHHGGLDRDVALKVLDPACARRPEFPLRFQREGQLLAALDHPHIVGVHDLGCEAGVYFLAMELVPGRTLRQRLADGPLPWTEAASLFDQLCDALQYAHDRGIVHRDIKPENILIGAGGQAKVGDFGIAKLIAPEGAGPAELTATDAVVGTRGYMAPEQLERDKPVDHRTDLYALAVVFYEMLTGELPLGVFAPPSRKAPVDPRLDAVLLKALAKDPDRRFRSAVEFREQVRQIGNRAPWPKRRTFLTKLIRPAALLLLLVLGLAGTWLLQPRGNGKVEAPPAPLTETMTGQPKGNAKAEAPPPTKPEEKTGPKILKGHKGRIWRVAFSRDGKVLATASEDRTVKLWDPDRGVETASWMAFPRGEYGYLSLAFSAGDKLLATAGGENLVRLWNLADQKPAGVLTGHGREVTALVFSPDGNILASASHDRSIRLWNMTTGKSGHILNGHTDPVLCVAFSRDGKFLASGAMNGEVKLWDVATGEQVGKCGHAKRVWAVAFSPDGHRLATGSHEANIKLWDLTRPPLKASVIADGPEVWSLAFAPSGELLASGSHDGVVRLWDAATEKLRERQTRHTAPVVSVAFSPGGRRLASGSWDHTAILWDVALKEPRP